MKLAPVKLDRERTSSQSSSVRSTPQHFVLTNGRYRSRISEVGSGHAEFNGWAVSRTGGDAVCDNDGFYLYLRDLDDELVWSAGYQPTRVKPAKYEFHCRENTVEILRADRNIECHLTAVVSPQHDCEIRLCRLTNSGNEPRRIEITSYVEWVLGSKDGDANHPAFSKLFVETQFCAKRKAILARRRPRQNDDPDYLGVHAVISANGTETEDVEYETNRMRFIGRGRTLRAPAALDRAAKLTGDSGAVLDPVGCLRTVIALEAGQSKEVAFLLGAASTHAAIDEMLREMADLNAVHALLDDVEAAEGGRSRSSASSNGHSGSSRPAFADAILDEKFKPLAEVGHLQVSAPARPADLVFDNGYGGFTSDGQEYVVRLAADKNGQYCRPPMPWVNVVANEHAGFLVTESGAGYTWGGNSRINRLTAWHNDPVCDPYAEAFWIRDDEEGVFWSPAPGPTPSGNDYCVRHGFGYSVFESTAQELEHELTMFMLRDDPVKVTRLRLVNRGRQTRRLSLFSFVHWGLGGLAYETVNQVVTSSEDEPAVIWARNPKRDLYDKHVAFSVPVVDETNHCEISQTADRRAFIGQYRDLAAPAAVVSSVSLDGKTGQGIDPCAAWQLSIELAPGATFECAFLLGETADINAARDVIAKHDSVSSVAQALQAAQQFWRDALTAITIETPARAIDLVTNGWLAYQNLSCRMWARSAYYQPGGAYGYRDQLQDSAALVYLLPEITRAQILRHASRQFVEGDVLHWWHPDTEYGLRTRFSDDLLWLPLLTAEYVNRTGDATILEEVTPFVAAPPLVSGHQEAYLRPEITEESDTVYEHCCRALDRGLTRGAHGLPLIGCGDWNDGMSCVGRDGQGESVWLGFFIEHLLQKFLPLCAARNDHVRVARYNEYREKLIEALNTTGWDGSWYRRAYYDNGQPIGSIESDECQIDALAQAWAVISGVASPERADMAVRAVEERLISNADGLIRLLTPPFSKTPNNPGYIKGYLPGIRENGGQYTHGVLWFIRAMAELGRGTRAVELLQMITPVWHTRDQVITDIYKTEPYVVAADVYGEPPHVGRGGWTWYTGSAGWMLRVAIESILGFSTENGNTIVLNPSISATWPSCKLNYRRPDGRTSYQITIENPAGKERGVTAATLDGQPVEVASGQARVPINDDGKAHRVVVRL